MFLSVAHEEPHWKIKEPGVSRQPFCAPLTTPPEAPRIITAYYLIDGLNGSPQFGSHYALETLVSRTADVYIFPSRAQRNIFEILLNQTEIRLY